MTSAIYTVVRPEGDESLGLIAETYEGPQELADRGATPPAELAKELGATLRLSEAAGDLEPIVEDGRMIINMGPQHPSTHGVLRIMMEIEGETVLRSKPVIGYLHTGMEKTAEQLTYLQGTTNVTRMDYLSPLNNELVFCLAAEDLLGVELPPRAVWIRMLMSELNRIASHVMWLATNGMDLGSTSMMIFGFRDREMVLSFFEKCSGLRMNNNYIRVGGVAADLPDGWEDDVAAIVDTIEARTNDYDELITGQPIFRERVLGVGIIRPEQAVALSATGPILRASGVPWDLRKTMPYLAYDQVDFDVVIGSVGDTYDRYAVRLFEIRQSIRIVRQILERMPKGPYRVLDPKVTPPPRARIDESMEALIHHFKLFTEGMAVPPGEVYAAVEAPKGEFGIYLVSDGANKPYRMKIRAPGFAHLAAMDEMARGHMIADVVAILATMDIVFGEIDR